MVLVWGSLWDEFGFRKGFGMEVLGGWMGGRGLARLCRFPVVSKARYRD